MYLCTVHMTSEIHADKLMYPDTMWYYKPMFNMFVGYRDLLVGETGYCQFNGLR